MAESGKGLWAQAAAMAAKAPPKRNRWVDFLRAFSIMAVVIGHWLVAAPWIENGEVRGGHLLGILPWTQWLTWGFQVMPVFFLVGGFSNGASWAATLRGGGRWSHWFTARLHRLVYPLLPLFAIWTGFALTGTALGVERDIVRLAAHLALVPVWFLSVYLMVSAVVPLTHAAWRRFGLASIAALMIGAVLVDVASLQYGVPWLNFANFAFVWLAVHQLGYAWNEGRLAGRLRALLLFLSGLAALLALVRFGPYPVAMIGVPGNELSNSMPPTLALLSLGIAQAGLVLLLEPAGRKWLGRAAPWTATVLVNGMIMTIYLWHLTAFVAVVFAAWLLGGVGLSALPGSSAWWLARPLWFACYIAATLPLVTLFVRFERDGSSRSRQSAGDVPFARLAPGVLAVCAGLALTAAISIASPEGVTGVRLWVVALPFLGAALIGIGPRVRAGTARRPPSAP